MLASDLNNEIQDGLLSISYAKDLNIKFIIENDSLIANSIYYNNFKDVPKYLKIDYVVIR